MEFEFKYSEYDDEYRFDISGKPDKSDNFIKFTSDLVKYTTGIYDEKGNLLVVEEGEILPDIPRRIEPDDAFSFFGCSGIAQNLLVNPKKTKAKINIHTYDCETLYLEPLTFTESQDTMAVHTSKAESKNKLVVLTQFTKFSTEGKKVKTVDFAEAGCSFENNSNEDLYVTYYIGTKKNDASCNAGRINLLRLTPGDTGKIDYALYHDQICEAFKLKKCTPKDLSDLILYPFLCIFKESGHESIILKEPLEED